MKLQHASLDVCVVMICLIQLQAKYGQLDAFNATLNLRRDVYHFATQKKFGKKAINESYEYDSR